MLLLYYAMKVQRASSSFHSCTYAQCAAVRTQSGAIRDPMQACDPSSWSRSTKYGYRPWTASSPLMMRDSARGDCETWLVMTYHCCVINANSRRSAYLVINKCVTEPFAGLFFVDVEICADNAQEDQYNQNRRLVGRTWCRYTRSFG